MKYKYYIVVALISVVIKGNAQSTTDDVRKILKAMSLEEKAKLVVGTGMKSTGQSNGAVGATMGKVNGAAGTTAPLERFNIPPIIMADGPAGVRIDESRGDNSKTYYCTAFPVGTLLASSWDRSLVKNVGEAIGAEAKAYGVDIILAPGVNIQRNPLGGRNFEYYSEDPYLSGLMGASMVNGIQSQGVGTSVKHFAANNQETNRTNSNSIVNERALREIYLKTFEILLQHSTPWTIMTSYNKINGVYTSENAELLHDILKGEWSYKGIVLTDWFAGKDVIAQLKAGNDLIMPGGASKTRAIIEAVKRGELDEKVLDDSVSRILSILLKTSSYNNFINNNSPDLIANAAVSRQAAMEGMVLLRNENTLPLQKDSKIALFGNNSFELITGGSGSSEVNKKYVINLNDGLKNAGFSVDNNLTSAYTDFLSEAKKKLPERSNLLETPKQAEQMPIGRSEIENLARINDVAIVTIGRNGGEGHDRKVNFDFNMTDAEKQYLQIISEIFHSLNKKVIVILNIDGVVETASWRSYADAILLAWQPGMEGGNAIASLLSGANTPSGKLPVTFPMSYNDVPSCKTYPTNGDEKQENAIYDEGIYVGYRYYDKYKVNAAYEFGFGLSYTSFKYSKIRLSSKSITDQVEVSIDITNTGNWHGKEVVQLYVSAPKNIKDNALKELKGFAKTRLLAPGEKQTLKFMLKIADLANFDTKSASWIVNPGVYSILAGSSSIGIKDNRSLKVKKASLIKKVSHKLLPQQSFEELK